MFPKTRICELLDVEYPVFQGGMAWVSTAELAAAVSNAGGLGIIAAGAMSPEMLRAEIQKTRRLTNKPFGVNLIMWEIFFPQQLDVVCEEEIKVITTGIGDPRPMMKRIKGLPIKVIPVVPTARHARRMEEAGVDAIVASGSEGGGHVGDVATLVTVARVVDSVKVPVIAAGGFCDARGMVAALALGACGIQMGTRFIVTRECLAHPRYKKCIIESTEEDTIVTGIYTGSPMRVIKNKFTEEWLAKEQAAVSKDDLRRLGVGRVRKTVEEGDIEYGTVAAGQVIGLIKEEKTVKEVIEEIIQGAKKIMERLGRGDC